MRAAPQYVVRMLAILLEEFGAEAIEAAIDEVYSGRAETTEQRSRSNRRKPSAEYIVHRDFRDSQKGSELALIAHSLDSKEFLPRISDIRNFLVMNGAPEPKTNNRQDTFKLVLSVIDSMPRDSIRQIRNSLFHSGPSRLDELSDAISSAGRQLRRS